MRTAGTDEVGAVGRAAGGIAGARLLATRRFLVDALLQQAAQAGAKLVKPAQATSYAGHAGYFIDPDGHLWEVAFNPGLASLG